ncbi:DUF1016 N-terminal domain-containing protein [Variovorax brevis]|uniref:DUF1016 N-terminal domain-containing protein n=1 Tax=Variovorax brevis TaxID=3053503 RepID=UPI003365ACB9
MSPLCSANLRERHGAGDLCLGNTRCNASNRRPASHCISGITTAAPTLFDYLRFVADLKRRIEGARLSAARAANRELVALYWDIGGAFSEQQATRGWGDAVVDRLARDLEASFPGSRGFSVASLWRMRQFHEVYAAPEFSRTGCARKGARVKAHPKRHVSVVDHRQLARLCGKWWKRCLGATTSTCCRSWTIPRSACSGFRRPRVPAGVATCCPTRSRPGL